MNQTDIATYFRQDHERLDQLYDQFQASKSDNPCEAKKYFKEFKAGLERHIVWEEELIFPIFELKTGLQDRGPTIMMRIEHKMIKESLEKVEKGIEEKSSDTCNEEIAFLNLLALHNEKEENILYPLIDHFASREEREKIFFKIEGNPGKEGCSCCDFGHPLPEILNHITQEKGGNHDLKL